MYNDVEIFTERHQTRLASAGLTHKSQSTLSCVSSCVWEDAKHFGVTDFIISLYRRSKRCGSMSNVNLFQADPSLGFPHFNTYRLTELPAASNIQTHPLPTKYQTTSSRISAGQQLAFKEIQARVGWDHTAAGIDANDILYIDESYNVIKVSIGVSRHECIQPWESHVTDQS